MEIDLASKIEGILFFKEEPMNSKKLAQILGVKEKEINESISVLKERLVDRGLVLIENNELYSLGTNPAISGIIEGLTKEELERDLGRAGLETLAIILYKSPVSKREIDYIRGVNSGFIIRNLLIRDLIERDEEKGERGYVYKPTIKLLSHLGISSLKELPEYESIIEEIKAFEERTEENDGQQ